MGCLINNTLVSFRNSKEQKSDAVRELLSFPVAAPTASWPPVYNLCSCLDWMNARKVMSPCWF